MGFKVMSKKCDQCLFGPNKIVSNARKAELIRKIHAEGTNFLCHKGTINGEEIVCAGDLEADRYRTNMMRIAERLGVIEEIDPDTYEVR